MEDTAKQAVEAALAAGATYADARVMEIRTEAMSARNGVIEALDREERAGVGVRALIGSSRKALEHQIEHAIPLLGEQSPV